MQLYGLEEACREANVVIEQNNSANSCNAQTRKMLHPNPKHEAQNPCLSHNSRSEPIAPTPAAPCGGIGECAPSVCWCLGQNTRVPVLGYSPLYNITITIVIDRESPSAYSKFFSWGRPETCCGWFLVPERVLFHCLCAHGWQLHSHCLVAYDIENHFFKTSVPPKKPPRGWLRWASGYHHLRASHCSKATVPLKQPKASSAALRLTHLCTKPLELPRE